MLKFMLKKRNVIMICIAIFSIVLISASAIFIYKYYKVIWKNKECVASYVVAFWGFLNWLKDRPKIYFFLAQLKALFFAGQTRWDLSANYQGNISKNQIDELKNAIKGLSKEKKIWEETDFSVSLAVKGMNIVVAITQKLNEDLSSEYDYITNVNVQLLEYHAPYHETLEILEEHILPLLNKLERIVRVEDVKYNIKILFEKSNPFYGLYLNHVGLDEVLDFQCRIGAAESIGELTKSVSITKERVSCYAITLSDLKSMTEKYLTVAWG